MESKKINQLATELAPVLSDLTIIGDPTTGISKKITLSQMASLFTGTVEEYPNLASFPLVGTADTIYIALDTNVLYRWDTGLTSYVELSPNIINSLVFSDANGFDGTISLVGSVATLTITTALTTGSVAFIGASGALTQDNSNFYWDNSNKRLGINTNAPTTAIDTFGSGIITRVNGTSTNNAFIGFASAGTNKWSIGNVQSDHRFRIYNEATTSELVSVLQTGEFGIGIANPTTKLHIDGGASALIANLDANVSVAKSISFRSDNSNRINLEVSGTESGSNSGANFFIRRYSDAGALIDTPLTIIRSSGNIGINVINPIGKLNIWPQDNSVPVLRGNAGVSTSVPAFEIFSHNSSAIQGGIAINTFNTTSQERFRITYDGLIGIGINSPQSIFHIGAPAVANSGIKSYTGLANSYEGFLFDYYYNTAASNLRVFDIVALGSSTTGIGGSDIRFLTVPQTTTGTPLERVRIKNNGNVGIGEINPTALLHISVPGTVGSTKFLSFERQSGYGVFNMYWNYENTYYTGGSTLDMAFGSSFIKLVQNNDGTQNRILTTGFTKVSNTGTYAGATNPNQKAVAKNTIENKP